MSDSISSKTQFVRSLVEKWPSGVVAQSEVGKFTGGILSGRTMANLHSLAKRGDYTGPPLPYKEHVGRKAFYFATDIAEFLWQRIKASH